MKTERKISAKIIADSINPEGQRITSFVLVFPRIILAELNTHRAFSRNSASSRAIPFNKMLESVENDPFIPIAWQKDHTGMQGSEYFNDELEIYQLQGCWLMARDEAVTAARNLSSNNVTKQICNRLLEPFLWHTAIVTATDFENLFALRAHEAAEIHIQKLAYEMLAAYNNSNAEPLNRNEWHIPFGDSIDEDRLNDDLNKISYVPKRIIYGLDFLTHAKLEIATARCARVSYLNFDGSNDYIKDLELYDRLSTSGHWSPFEHCAYVPTHLKHCGNFKGWVQLRKTFRNENKTDERVEH